MAPLRNSCESRSGTPISQTVAAVRGGVMVTMPRFCDCPSVTAMLAVGFVNGVKMLELGIFPVAVVKVPAAPRPNAQSAYVPGMTWGMVKEPSHPVLTQYWYVKNWAWGSRPSSGAKPTHMSPDDASGASVS